MKNNTTVFVVSNTTVLEKGNILVFNSSMKFSERLKLARKHADLSQEELADAIGVTQGLISKIERGDQEESAYVVKMARICGVRPEWLDDGSGEMTDGLYVESEKIKKAVLLMQELPEYALDEAIKGLDSVSKLSKMAK
jgi:transcriptional regulator with XRE-family HTH domain